MGNSKFILSRLRKEQGMNFVTEYLHNSEGEGRTWECLNVAGNSYDRLSTFDFRDANALADRQRQNAGILDCQVHSHDIFVKNQKQSDWVNNRIKQSRAEGLLV